MVECPDTPRFAGEQSQWFRLSLLIIGDDSPDPAEADGLLQLALLDLLAQIRGDELAVLDDSPVDINDIQVAVGTDLYIDGSESFIGGREECLLDSKKKNWPQNSSDIQYCIFL